MLGCFIVHRVYISSIFSGHLHIQTTVQLAATEASGKNTFMNMQMYIILHSNYYMNMHTLHIHEYA